MIDLNAQIIGDKRLIKKLNSLAPRLKKKVMKSAMRKGASVVAKRAKTKVKKRSGFLRKSIKAKSTKNGNARIFVSPKVEGEYRGKTVKPAKYAHLVEFGTQAAEAHPFLRPALNESKEEAFDAVASEARKQFNKINM